MRAGAEFDGADDYFEVDHVLDPAAGSFSTALWFNLTDYDANRPILGQINGTGTGRSWFGIGTGGRLSTYLGGTYVPSASTLTPGQWHHAALSYDGTTLNLYLDGQLEASESKTMESSNGEMLIGANKNFGAFFKGTIDELVLYNRTLSASEVTLLASTNPWQSTTLDTPSAFFSTWNATVPPDLADGPYKIDLWATDSLGNARMIPNAWTGEIDLHAPTVTFTYNDNGDGTAQVSCDATDYNLTQAGWLCPVNTVISQTQPAEWYGQIFSDTQQLYRLYTPEETVSTSDGDSMTACDIHGHCTTASTSASANLEGLVLTPNATNGGAAITVQESYQPDIAQHPALRSNSPSPWGEGAGG